MELTDKEKLERKMNALKQLYGTQVIATMSSTTKEEFQKLYPNIDEVEAKDGNDSTSDSERISGTDSSCKVDAIPTPHK